MQSGHREGKITCSSRSGCGSTQDNYGEDRMDVPLAVFLAASELAHQSWMVIMSKKDICMDAASDFECSYCRTAGPTLAPTREKLIPAR